MRLLVAEDYQPLLRSLRQGLQEAGYSVDACAEGRGALELAQATPYDAIVLDLMLPGLDGLSIVRRLRQSGAAIPVLLLTARDQVADRVAGLDAGADDYLVKPFAFAELLARLRALVRRGYGETTHCLRIADLEVDTRARTVRRAGREIVLSAKEYALLEYLLARRGQVVSRSDIWTHVYDFASEPASNVIDVYIGYLRKKLAHPGAPALIHTRRGQGYVLGEDA